MEFLLESNLPISLVPPRNFIRAPETFSIKSNAYHNKLPSSVDAIAISEIWNYRSLTHWVAVGGEVDSTM